MGGAVSAGDFKSRGNEAFKVHAYSVAVLSRQ